MKTYLHKSWLLLMLCFSLSNFALAQNNQVASFTAYADAKEVVLNGYFKLTFTLKNATGGNFTPPSFADFTVLSGPSKMMQSTIVNGRRSQEMSISYELQPKRAGTFTIGSGKIGVRNQTLQTQPITIRVQQGNASSNESAEVFLRARLSSSMNGPAVKKVFLGQQLIMDYILYSRVDIQGLTASSESTYDGFFMREIHQYDTRQSREIIDGVQYVTRILKRVVLYPQRTGSIEIEPLSIIAGVAIEGQRPRSFFSRPNVRRVPVSTESTTLQVVSLPQPQPAKFSNITGNFKLGGQLSSSSITTDDALSLKLVVEGQGDLKRVQAPKLNFPEEFEVYDPKVVEEQYIDLASEIKGRKIFEYLLVPKKAGRYNLAPQVVIFNPDSLDYQTLRLGPVGLEVRQGTGERESGLVAEADQVQNQGLYPARPISRLNAPSDSFFGTPVFWGLFLLPIVLAGGLVVRQRIEAGKPTIDPITLQKQRARQRALDRLKVAEEHRQANAPRQFYESVERGLLGYIGDKLQIDRANMTKAHVANQLQQLGANDSQRELFQSLIRTCEMALYAGKDNANAMEETYTQAVALLAEMEEVLG